jgi:alanine dehydrogenase
LGVEKIHVYGRKNSHLLGNCIDDYDVIVGCARPKRLENGTWEIILSEEDLKNMKPGALLVCLGDGMPESFKPRSIYNPVFEINDGKNLVYYVDHVPTLVHETASKWRRTLKCCLREER